MSFSSNQPNPPDPSSSPILMHLDREALRRSDVAALVTELENIARVRRDLNSTSHGVIMVKKTGSVTLSQVEIQDYHLLEALRLQEESTLRDLESLGVKYELEGEWA